MRNDTVETVYKKITTPRNKAVSYLTIVNDSPGTATIDNLRIYRGDKDGGDNYSEENSKLSAVNSFFETEMSQEDYDNLMDKPFYVTTDETTGKVIIHIQNALIERIGAGAIKANQIDADGLVANNVKVNGFFSNGFKRIYNSITMWSMFEKKNPDPNHDDGIYVLKYPVENNIFIDSKDNWEFPVPHIEELDIYMCGNDDMFDIGTEFKIVVRGSVDPLVTNSMIVKASMSVLENRMPVCKMIELKRNVLYTFVKIAQGYWICNELSDNGAPVNG